ncbi:MAG: TatD family hydrolase [Muribaculaceae bacterium]|nr:TatD family hydrolase [Muribaculaceae bacterium]
MFDTHTHIYLPEFEEDCNLVIERAKEAGVTIMMLPNVDVETISPLKKVLESNADCCVAAMGLHPTSVAEDYKARLDEIFRELENGEYKAVGEVGVDLYWDKTFRAEQLEVFAEQLRWAATKSLPVIIHNREAIDDTIAVLRQNPIERFVMHSFGGSPNDVKRVREVGDAYFGINGVATFKNARLEDTIKEIGLDRLVVETDAPYLSPVPYRGKRNEPAYIVNTVYKIAEVLSVSKEEVEKATFDNACRLFSL